MAPREHSAIDDPEATEELTTLIGIGALSKASGVPVETLRTWERRYGFPKPVERSGTKHRRYPLSAVRRLREAKRLLGLGHKPSVVLTATLEELDALRALNHEPTDELVSHGNVSTDVELLLDAAGEMNGEKLERLLQHAWDELGAIRFVGERGAQFVTEVGERWHRKEWSVSQEHFATARFRDFLASKWRRLAHGSQGAPVVCTTLANERHDLGASMAAVVLALSGLRPIFLGADTPTPDIASAVAHTDAAAVVLSASSATDIKELHKELRSLRMHLPSHVEIVGGGAGFNVPGNLPNVRHISDFDELMNWATER